VHPDHGGSGLQYSSVCDTRWNSCVCMQIVKTTTLLRSQLPADVLAKPVPLDANEVSQLMHTSSHALLRGNAGSGYVRFAPSHRAAAAAEDSAAVYSSGGKDFQAGGSSGVVGGGKGGTCGTASWSFDAPERTPRGAGIQLPLSSHGSGCASSTTTAAHGFQHGPRQSASGAPVVKEPLYSSPQLSSHGQGSPQPSSHGGTTASWASFLPLRPLAADRGGMRMPSMLQSPRSVTPPSSPPAGGSSAYVLPPARSEGSIRQGSRWPPQTLRSRYSADPPSPSQGVSPVSWASDLVSQPLSGPPLQLSRSTSPLHTHRVGHPEPCNNASSLSGPPTPPSSTTPLEAVTPTESFHTSTALLPSSAAVDSAEAPPESPRGHAADVSVSLPEPSVQLLPTAAALYSTIHRNPSYREMRARDGLDSTDICVVPGDDSAIAVPDHPEEFLPSLPTLSETYRQAVGAGAGSASLALVPLGSASGRMWPEAETAQLGYPTLGSAPAPSSAPAHTGPPVSPLVEPSPPAAALHPLRQPLPIAVLHAASCRRPRRQGNAAVSRPAPLQRDRRLSAPGGAVTNGRLASQPQKTSVSLGQAYSIACGERQ
jgi:hypothetical protein